MEDGLELERKVRREADSFWVQKMIFEPNRDFIQTFFEFCEKALEPNSTSIVEISDWQSAKQEAIKDFNLRFYDLRRRIEDPLILVSSEFRGLTEITEKVQDLITVALDLGQSAVAGSQYQKKAQIQLSEYRMAFLRECYEAQKRFTDSTSLKGRSIG